MYGIIDENYFSLASPREIDYGPFETIEEAFDCVCEMMKDREDIQASIVKVVSSKKAKAYVEDLRVGGISVCVDSESCEF